MPSKRKKNKRRMRRVQAQRRVLEEQYSSSGKGTPGVRGVSAPVPTQIPVPKTSECPILVPIKTPLAMVAPVDVPDEIPSAEQVVLEVLVTDAIKDKGMMAAEDLTEALVEPPIEEPAVLEEPESVTIPLAEVTATIDEPVSIPAESEIQVEDRSPVVTEIHVVAKLVQTVDTVRGDEAAAGLHAEDLVVKVPVPEETAVTSETLADIETVTETLTTEAEPVAEAAVETSEPAVQIVGGPVVEAEAITVEAEPLEVHMEVTEIIESVHGAPEPEEDPVDVHADPEPEKVSVETVELTEALVKPEPDQQSVPLEERTPLDESTSDPVAEDYVGTESAIPVGVEAAITEEQIPEIPADAPEVLSETMAETIPATVPLPKEIIHAQDEFMAQVETEVKKDLAVGGGLTVDAINGCLATTEVAIEG
ncbi:magnetosome-associated protein MamJ-like isoform X4 [Xyrauchen texanus]|uniref:magnetosome-associated protein MamJ-like isoform X3 n=1 Tax=Xyrauchen texanus TaxID=154827 RepID=UPI0022429CB1|nr:magnetosome-associated protein MamJ-like isoform X3 [Xyrauchen texanus]XP_051963900.1 magnetosome-associated protein MamJ-like isoform X4 [Xyrauchen texanus]